MTEPGGEPPSYGTLVGRLLQDGEDFAKAKVEVYRQLAFLRARQLRAATILGVAGALVLSTTVIIVSVGALMALGASIGFVWATAIMTGAVLLIGVVLLLLARKTLPNFDLEELEEPVPAPEETPR